MDIIAFVLLVAFFLFLAAMISIVIWSLRNGIAPMPTSIKAKKCLLEALPEHVSGPIYELGSGWGTLAFPIAKKYPNTPVYGYETSPVPYLVSRLFHPFASRPNLTFRREDFIRTSLNDAALVVCYLYPGAMKRLKDKLNAELKPGTWVISNTFAIPGWDPVSTYPVGDIYHTKIYVYRVPFDKN